MNLTNTFFEISAYNTEQLPESSVPEIVCSGRSNVGKSSMINKLINRKSLARVSSAPGKTASVNFYNCETFRLVDLPGYGFARVSPLEKEKWSELVEGYFGGERDIRLVIQLLDARHALSNDDMNMLNYLKQIGLPYIAVMTKCDKMKNSEFEKRKIEIPFETGITQEANLIYFSAVTGKGIEELKRAMDNSLNV